MKLIKLADAVAESARLLRATLPARLSLDVQFIDQSSMVMADVTQIEQVVINLVTNSMQAMANGPGKISIGLDNVLIDQQLANNHPANSALQRLATEHQGRSARLTVTDNGAGMDAKTLARIFEPFFTTKPVDEGTGLGLAVVHGIIESHAGAIVVESIIGKGTTFTIYLPLAANVQSESLPEPTNRLIIGHADEPAETREAVKTTSNQTLPIVPIVSDQAGAQHILYIDDDDSMLFLVSRLLERKGFQVSTFDDQQEALDVLAKNPHSIHLLVTDFNMPGLSGLDVARAAKVIRADLPVAIASGFIDEALRDAAAAAGVRELIFKANGAEEFCDAVTRLVMTASPLH